MGDRPTGNAVAIVEKTAGTQVSQYCLGLPTVLKKVLENFSRAELLELSLVNKQWNYEARHLLRVRGTLTARIRSGDHNGLEAFASDLEKMNLVPFSGICVIVSHDDFSICQPVPNASYNVILERLPLKTLSVEFLWDWNRCIDCPALVLVDKILDKFCGTLEVLCFTYFYFEDQLVRHCLTDWSFPRMKILRIGGYAECWFVRALVSTAPHLEELQMNEHVHFNENVLEGSSAVLVPRYCFNPIIMRICESLISAIRLETIEIYQMSYYYGSGALGRFTPRVLQVSLPTLKTLGMDILFAVPLTCYGICLENVTTLKIRLNGKELESLEPRILTLLKRVDFTRIFPKVLQVEIVNERRYLRMFSAKSIEAFVEQANAMLMPTLRDRAINIKELTLHDYILDSTIPLLAEMFPDVKVLSVKTMDRDFPPPFTAIWDHFSNLHELNITSYRLSFWTENKDSVFCGIFPEEVDVLREKDDEYLKAVNIVPVMPSITCMKGLKTFTFRYTPEDFPAFGDNSTFWFSKVTGFLGFARCPGLAVTFQARTLPCEEVLSEMEPFATFTSVDY